MAESAKNTASSASRLKRGVERFELYPGIVTGELPLSFSAFLVSPGGGRFALLFKLRPRIDAIRDRSTQDCRDFALRDIEPASVLWRVMPLETLCKSTRLGGFERLVERAVVVSVEVVFDQDDFLRLWEHFLADEPQCLSVVQLGAGGVFGNEDFPHAKQRRIDHEGGGAAFADVFVVVARGCAGLAAQWRADFTKQLFAELVKTHQRVARILRALINFKHILHRRDEASVLFGRDAPALAQPRFDVFFFMLPRTVSCEMASTTSSSTSLSASSRRLQRFWPSGACEQAIWVS